MTDPHLAAYAKGLEDALSQLLPMIPVGAEDDAKRFIAALLPPGTRVVVVPPEGSEEWEALVERVASAILPEFYGGCSGGELVELGASVARDHARAALRALTGGEP